MVEIPNFHFFFLNIWPRELCAQGERGPPRVCIALGNSRFVIGRLRTESSSEKAPMIRGSVFSMPRLTYSYFTVKMLGLVEVDVEGVTLSGLNLKERW